MNLSSAYHEAGHALFCHLMGITQCAITKAPEGAYLTYDKNELFLHLMNQNPKDINYTMSLAMLIIDISGVVAESLLKNFTEWMKDEDVFIALLTKIITRANEDIADDEQVKNILGSVNDIRDAFNDLGTITNDNVIKLRLIFDALGLAMNKIKENWTPVTQLAKHLARHNFASQKDVNAIFCEVPILSTDSNWV